MKTLILYFSATGNTEWVAEQIHEEFYDSHLVGIKVDQKLPKNKFLRTFLLGFKMVMNHRIPITAVKINLENYDKIIIGAPVWMGKIPLPFKAFLENYNFENKEVAGFATYGGDKGEFFTELEEVVNTSLKASLVLEEPLFNYDERNKFQIVDFTNALKRSWYKTTNVV